MIILRRPIITEKSMTLTKSGFYTFEVDRSATKKQVEKVVKDTFAVDVLSVRIINSKVQSKWQRRVRRTYQVGASKKAIVSIKKGQKIAIFEAQSTPEEATVTTAESEPQIMKEKRNMLRTTKVKVERSATGASPTTQRKVITGK
jgi:large subunit ribosomal protein L23